MADEKISIRDALEKALEKAAQRGDDTLSVEGIVRALDTLGFVCDLEDVRGAFQELEGWALMQPPFNLTAHEGTVVLAAQRSVLPGPTRYDRRVTKAQQMAWEFLNPSSHGARVALPYPNVTGPTIRKALQDAAGPDTDSVAKIVTALEKAGFDCDRDKAQGGFAELQGWALMLPPIDLAPRQMSLVSQAQRYGTSGKGPMFGRVCDPRVVLVHEEAMPHMRALLQARGLAPTTRDSPSTTRQVDVTMDSKPAAGGSWSAWYRTPSDSNLRSRQKGPAEPDTR